MTNFCASDFFLFLYGSHHLLIKSLRDLSANNPTLLNNKKCDSHQKDNAWWDK